MLASHPDPKRLGREPERRAVAVEPRAGGGGQAKLGFVATVEDLLANLSVGILVGDLDDTVTERSNRDNADNTGKNAGHPDARREILESHHVPLAGQIGGIGLAGPYASRSVGRRTFL